MIVLALSTALLFVLRSALTTPLIALLWLLPVGLATAVWGLGPGVLAAALAFLSFNFFFIQPYYAFRVHQSGDVLVLLVFLFVAVVISQLVGRAQAGMKAASAREREATQLYGLSTALVGQGEAGAIARVAVQPCAQDDARRTGGADGGAA